MASLLKDKKLALLRITISSIIISVCVFVGNVSFGQVKEPLINNYFFLTDLREAIQDIALQAGRNVIIAETISGNITLTLEDANFTDALNSLLAGSLYKFREFEDYVNVYDPRNLDTMSDLNEGIIFQPENQPASYLVELLPDDLKSYITISEDGSVAYLQGSNDVLSQLLSTLEQIDVASEIVSKIIHLNGLDFNSISSTLVPNLQNSIRYDVTSDSVILVGTNALVKIISKQVNAMIEAYSIKSRSYNEEFKIISVDHVSPEELVKLMPFNLKEILSISVDERKVSLSGPVDKIKQATDIIEKIDQPEVQIQLTARVVALNQSEFLTFGTEIEYPEIVAGVTRLNGATPATTNQILDTWELSLGYSASRAFTNALAINLALMAQNNNATIVATPRVVADNGNQAEIKVTTREYFQLVIEKDGNSTASLEEIETGTILSIRPLIDRNGLITLDIDINVSDVVARGENNLPTVVAREASSKVTVQNGGTAAIAGLVDTRTSGANQGVPGIRKLPLLGSGFSKETLTHDVKQVAIFITATTLDPGKDSKKISSAKPKIIKLDNLAFENELKVLVNQND